MVKFSIHALILVLFAMVSACQSKQKTVTRELGDGAVLSVTLQPFPLVVGTTPEIYATLRVQRTAGTGCRVQLRQFPLDVGDIGAMWLDIPEQSRSGIYRRVGGLLSNDGKWRFEFNIQCSEDYAWRGVTFDFPVVSQVE